jgi:mono/diheme cytochrome c family protein
MSKARSQKSTLASASSQAWLARLFVLAAALLVGFWLLWWSAFIVHRAYVAGDSAATNGGRLDLIWSFLLTGGLIWGAVNVYWAIQAAKQGRERTFHSHWLIAIACGLAVVGIEGVMAARTLTLAPIIMDFSEDNGAALASKTDTATAQVIAGDPDLGQQVFGKACVTCHGPTGGGMPNLAPSLVGSEFVRNSDDGAITKVIRLGRGVEDPNNKSKKVMPARGGNPFLSDNDIAHLVAFVRKIQSQPLSGSESSGAAALQLAAWVVPPPKRPDADLDWKQVELEQNSSLQTAELYANRRVSLLRWLTLGLTGIHALLMVGVLILSSSVVVPRLLSGVPSLPIRLVRAAVHGWSVACVSWVLIAALCFWWS